MTPSPDLSPGSPVPGPRLLIGDAERALAQDRLGRAVGCGELSLDEFDDRLQAALRARTHADLEPLLADLPSASTGTGVPIAWTPPTAAVFSPSLQVAGRPGSRVTPRGDAVVARTPLTGPAQAWARWAALAALLIAVWVAVGIPTGAWYPWPVWPILGTAVCAVRQSVERAGVGRSGVGA